MHESAVITLVVSWGSNQTARAITVEGGNSRVQLPLIIGYPGGCLPVGPGQSKVLNELGWHMYCHVYYKEKRKMAERTDIAIMYLGRIMEIGSKECLFTNPMHPYTKALLAAIPVPTPNRKRHIKPLQGEVPSAINIPQGCRFHPRCPNVSSECAKTEPPLIEIEKNHLVACHHY